MGRLLLGLLIGAVLVPVFVLCWLWFGRVPVAVADPPFSHEQSIVAIPLQARINHEMIKKVPIPIDEDNLVAGAHVYSEKCASCHGFHGKPSLFAAHMYPVTPQLWEKHPGSEIVGVSDDAPGATFWKVSNGIRLTGMPAYKGVLNDTEIWQVSLLLANADKPLPPAAVEILRGDKPTPAITDESVTAATLATERGAASKTTEKSVGRRRW